MMRFWACVLIFCSCCLNLRAQSPYWTTFDTHLDENILKLTTDSLGFVWQLTPNGLYKFDGLRSIKKTTSNKTIGQFTCIGKTSEMGFVLGTSKGFLVFYDPYSGAIVFEKWMESPITNLHCPSAQNDCLSVSYGHGIKLKKERLNKEFSTDEGLVSNEVYQACILGNEVIVASDQGLQRLGITKNGLQSLFTSGTENGDFDIILTQLKIHGNDLWLTDFDASVQQINSNGKTGRFPLTRKEKINELYIHDGTPLVATSGGLYQLRSGKFEQLFPSSGENEVVTMTIDEEHNIWLVTAENKLMRGSMLFQRFQKFSQEIQSLAYDKGVFYVGFSDKLLKGNFKTGFSEILKSNVNCLKVSEAGNIWVGTFSEGLMIYSSDGKLLEKKNSWEGFDQQSVLDIALDKGKAYVSSLSGVEMFEIEETANRVIFKKMEHLNDRIGDGFVYQTLPSNQGIFFGMDRQGLRIYDGDQLTSVTRLPSGEKLGSVLSMALTSNGLWFSSSELGLCQYQDGLVKKVDTSDPDKEAYTAIIPIDHHELLMIKPKSFEIFDIKKLHFMSFDEELDLRSSPAFLNAYTQDSNYIYIANNDRIYTFKKGENLKTDPEIIIDLVDVNLTHAKGRHVFEENENNIQFSFSGSWMSDALKINYQYKMDGYDTHWRQTKDRSVSYPKLPPGNYTFRVRASETTSFSNEPEVSYAIEIKQRFYKTRIFLIACSLLILYLIYKLLSVRREAQLRKIEMESKHVTSQLVNLRSQINPHFLFNSFNTLMGLIEEDDKERSLSFVENLTDFYRLVLEHSKNQLVTFNHEIKLVKLYIKLLNERFEDSISLVVPESGINTMIPPLTMQLLIENAVKHNEVNKEKHLTIEIRQEGDFLYVSNNKRKKLYAPVSSGSGLENIRKRYELLNPKSIDIIETADSFTVKLPVIYESSHS